MKKYILGRFIRSIFSILCVVSIAIVLIFTMIERDRVFQKDGGLQKLGGKPDEIISYKYTRWEELGYLDFQQQADMCLNYSDDYQACIVPGSKESKAAAKILEEKGYTVSTYTNGKIWATRDYTPLELIYNFFSNLIVIDGKNAVQDPDNPNLERKVYVGKDFNGRPAVKCSGCENEYLLYVNGSFPFIHQNWISLNFGLSFPTFSGLETLEVISTGQGNLDQKPVEFPSGVTANSAFDLYTCQYKPSSTLDRFDKQRFETNYANCKSNYVDRSMIGNSYLFGIISLIIAYLIAIPSGVIMARKKDKWQDKLGLIYINFMISVPSLAFIYFFKTIGVAFGLPDKFPILGPGDVRSYVLPMIILGLMSTSSLMIWIRRYMVDQTNADYVKFARAKGLSQKEIFNRHILKNAIIPIVNGIPSSIILCISGAVLTETIFSIPGMGKMLPDSITANNNTMIITLTFIFTALSVISLLVGDVLMAFVDPRIQLSTKGGTR